MMATNCEADPPLPFYVHASSFFMFRILADLIFCGPLRQSPKLALADNRSHDFWQYPSVFVEKEAGHRIQLKSKTPGMPLPLQVRELVQQGDFFFGGTQVKVWQGVVEDLRTTFLEPCNGMVWAGLYHDASTIISKIQGTHRLILGPTQLADGLQKHGIVYVCYSWSTIIRYTHLLEQAKSTLSVNLDDDLAPSVDSPTGG